MENRNIRSLITVKRVILVGHAAHVKAIRKVYKLSIRNPEEDTPSGRPQRIDGSHLAQNIIQWRASAISVMHPQFT